MGDPQSPLLIIQASEATGHCAWVSVSQDRRAVSSRGADTGGSWMGPRAPGQEGTGRSTVTLLTVHCNTGC